MRAPPPPTPSAMFCIEVVYSAVYDLIFSKCQDLKENIFYPHL